MPDTITVDIGGAKLVQGPQGPAGPVFTPSISEDGVVSWTNNGGLENPPPVSVKGDNGPQGPKGDKGDTGDTGPAGPQGATGPQGDTGATGAQGPKGDKGDKGDTGYVFTPSINSEGVVSWTNNGGLPNPDPVSVRGPQGIQGPTGETGPQGPQGERGLQGEKGDTGDTGPQGPQGIQGKTGPEGPQGERGLQGDKGDTGDTGPQGPTGPQGEQGPKGDTGDPGEDGGYYSPSVDSSGNLSWTASKTGMPGVAGTNIKGPKGDKGDPGQDGADGAPGETGPQGPQGPQGPKGDTGSGLEILGQYDSLEDLQSGVPSPEIGDNYYVGMSAPYDIYTWTDVDGTPGWVNGGPLQGAKGDAGEDGGYYQPSVDSSGNLTWAASKGGMPTVQGVNIRGPQGIQGPAGADGQDGTPGAQGPAGAAGADGEDGGYYTPAVDGSGNLTWAPSKEDMPPVGSVNIKGPKGDTGETGPQGPAGAKGDTGDTGPAGPAGSDGAPGAKGTTFTPSVDSAGNLSWTNDGSLENPATVNIKGPKGDKGETGPAGADGAQGPKGDTGNTGPAGADGGYYTPSVNASGDLTWTASKSGMASVDGANIRGPQGAQGPQGPQGPAGADGQDGAQGPTGPAGAAATINGVNALTLSATGGLSGSQSGNTYTIDGSGLKPIKVPITIPTTGWSDNKQTFTVSGIPADTKNHVVMLATDGTTNTQALEDAGLRIAGEGANSLTLKVSTVPTTSFQVYAVITMLA